MVSRCLCAREPKKSLAEETLIKDKYGIRTLTVNERFKLMGFPPGGINLKGLSISQCSILAGNGWDINLVSKIIIIFLK